MDVLVFSLLVLPLWGAEGSDISAANVFKKCEHKTNKNLHINRTVHLVSWVNNPPYLFKKGANETTGILLNAIESLLWKAEKFRASEVDVEKYNYITRVQHTLDFTTESQLKEKIENTNMKDLFAFFNTTPYSSDIFVLAGTTYSSENTRLFQRVPVIFTKEAVLIVHTKDVFFLTKFLLAIWTCKGIIFFAATCAINLAAIIWILEFRTNSGFAKTFGAGLCDGLWFCFVTMTTVGYGDKVPQHFLSRILCLAWMVFGLMLTGIITTVVLETTQSDFPVVGKRIGILNCTVQSALVSIKLSAEPAIYPTTGHVLTALRDKEVDAVLLDSSVAAYIFKEEQITDLKMVLIVIMKIWLYAYFFQPKDDGVLFRHARLSEDESINLRSEFVPSYHVSRYHTRDMQELYDVKSGIGIVVTLTITSTLLVCTGVFAEVYKLARHLLMSQQKSRRRKMTEEMHLISPNCHEMEILKGFEDEFYAKIDSLRQTIEAK